MKLKYKTCRDEAVHKNLTPCSWILVLGKEVLVAKRNGCEAVSPFHHIAVSPHIMVEHASLQASWTTTSRTLVLKRCELSSHKRLLAIIAMARLPMRLECTIWDCCSVACNAGIDTCVLQDEAVWDDAMNYSPNSYLYRTNNVPKSAKVQE